MWVPSRWLVGARADMGPKCGSLVAGWLVFGQTWTQVWVPSRWLVGVRADMGPKCGSLVAGWLVLGQTWDPSVGP